MALYCTIIDTDGKAEIETITNFLIAYNFATSRVSILFSQFSKKGAKINEAFLMICKKEMIILKQRSVGSTKNLRLQLRE